MNRLSGRFHRLLRWSEQYTKTDMVYLVTQGWWVNLNTVVSTLCAFLLSIAFAHFLPKETFGMYQYALTIAAILGALSLTGMNTAVTQSVARGYEGTLRKSFGTQLVWGIVPLIAGLGIAAYYFIQGNLTLSISLLIVALLLPLLNAANTYSAFLLGKKRAKTLFYFNQCVSLLYHGTMLLAVIAVDSSIPLVATNFVVNTVVTLGLYFATLRYATNDRVDPEADSYGKQLSFTNALMLVALQIDNVVAFHYVGAAGLAVYVFASTIPERLQTVTKSVSQLALPKFSTADIGELRETIVGKTLRLLAFSIGLAVVYVLLAPFLFSLFFPQYLEAVPYTQVYVFAAAITSASSLPVTALLAVRARRAVFWLNLSSALLQIAAFFLLGALFGLWGIIIARLLSGAGMTLASLALVARLRPPASAAPA